MSPSATSRLKGAGAGEISRAGLKGLLATGIPPSLQVKRQTLALGSAPTVLEKLPEASWKSGMNLGFIT
jgi:hypothetical protein